MRQHNETAGRAAPLSDEDLPLQRCVDGELSDVAQQELLARLDRAPDGWRRLALAFVEDQVWRATCRDSARQPVGAGRASTSGTPAGPPRSSSRPTWLSALRPSGIAAALLFGVGIGLIVDGLRRDPPEVEQVAATGDGAAQTVAEREPAPPLRTEDRPQPVFNVRLTAADGAAPLFELPVYDPADLAGHLWPLDEIVPPHVREVLTGAGYLVERSRRMYAIPLDDDLQVSFPVDTVRIRHAHQ